MNTEPLKTHIRTYAREAVDLSFYDPKPVVKAHGHTQQSIAEKLHMTQSSVNKMMGPNPSIAQVKLLADTIGCSFFDLFNLDNPPLKTIPPTEIPPTHLNRCACPACGATFALTAHIDLTPIP